MKSKVSSDDGTEAALVADLKALDEHLEANVSYHLNSIVSIVFGPDISEQYENTMVHK